MPRATRLVEADTRIEEGVQDVGGQVDDHKDTPLSIAAPSTEGASSARLASAMN